MSNIVALGIWIFALLFFTWLVGRPGKCPVCKSQQLDYDQHGYEGKYPVCKNCHWDSYKEQHVMADLDDIFLEDKGGKK